MNRIYVKFIVLLCIILGFNASAQRINFNTQKNWSLNKKELLISFGPTQFLGDLGGANSSNYDYSLKDWDWQALGGNAGIGYRFRFHPKFATTSNLSYLMLRGDDKYSEEYIRFQRNLHFRTHMVEFQQRLEFILFSVEKFAPAYNLPGARGGKRRNQQYYVFGGVGASFFIPQAKYQDSWVALRPLKTEGQAKPYSPIAFTVPAGFGFRVGLGTQWRIGIEATYNMVFSDYVDDVSTVYADPNSFADPAAAFLSNPSDPSITVGIPNGSVGGYNWFGAGYQRGDNKQRDSYYRLNIVLAKNLTYKDYGRQRIKTTGSNLTGKKIR